MNVRAYWMRPDDAPPGPWWHGADARLVHGVELRSGIPTRFFQSVDAYPSAWGRLLWRVQLNTIESDRIAQPAFRTFYSGVEWNLNHPGHCWFLTAWFRWDGPGPDAGAASTAPLPAIEGGTVLFPFAVDAPSGAALCLRSRVDARERRHIAEAVRAEREPPKRDATLIVLDDVLGSSG